MGKPLEESAVAPGAAQQPDELDPAALMALQTDRLLRAHAARATFGISPVALALAFGDWWLHLAASPGKQVELVRKAGRKWLRYAAWLPRARPIVWAAAALLALWAALAEWRARRPRA